MLFQQDLGRFGAARPVTLAWSRLESEFPRLGDADE